ncbi:MAG: hypothetical protein ABSH50_23770 [Bryobacteraceae bacterium]
MIRFFIDMERVRGIYPCALAFLFVALPSMCRAQVPPAYTISTVVGTCTSSTCTASPPTCPIASPGDGGAASSAQLCGPAGLAFDSSGNLYIADANNNRIREVSTGGTISTVAGNGTAGFAGDGSSPTASGTELNAPSAIAFDSHGNLYIADTGNYEIREIYSGDIHTVAGENSLGAGGGTETGGGGCAVPCSAVNAQLNNPSGVAVDSSGNIYLSDPNNNQVDVVCQTQTPIACTATFFGSITFIAGDLSVFAGNEVTGAGYTGDAGPATGALLDNPEGLAMDSAGNLYIADTDNNVIRKVAPSGVVNGATINGLITTVAGNGIAGYSGDDGPATQATLNGPKSVAVDANGNLYIADTFNGVIRMVEPNGTITTIAGNQSAGPGYSGDGGAATSAQMYFPNGLAVYNGKVYVSDTENNVIRLLTPQAQSNPPQINAGGVITASAFGGSTTVAPGSWIEIYGTNLASGTATWQQSNFVDSVAPVSLNLTSVTIGGQSAYMYYVSATQVDVQVPNVTAGTQPLVLTSPQGSSSAYSLTVAAAAPGLYAPSFLNIGGKQYVGAVSPTSPLVWALPAGAVSGLTCQPAAPGSTIVLYGVGFGTVTPGVLPGQIDSGQTSLATQVQFNFGSTAATTNYQGLAPGLVGLYQFNVVVPTITANNAVPLTFSQGGVAGTQTLYTAVGAPSN